MNQFFKQLFIFSVIFDIAFIIGIILPATPASKEFYIQSTKPKKDSLLIVTKDPRIIFIGGSNLVFGLNSQMIKDSLQRNPINAALSVGIGSVYMMDDVLPFIKKNDIVVFALEYEHYYGNYGYGRQELLQFLLDGNKKGFYKLKWGHIPIIVRSAPDYILSKYKIRNYRSLDVNDIYSHHGFNEYGDNTAHWSSQKQHFPLLRRIEGNFNERVFEHLKQFNEEIAKKGATLYITYPCLQESSYIINQEQILFVQDQLEKSELRVLGTSARYVMPDSLMFDTPYHLIKKGVSQRTSLLIEDIKPIVP